MMMENEFYVLLPFTITLFVGIIYQIIYKIIKEIRNMG